MTGTPRGAELSVPLVLSSTVHGPKSLIALAISASLHGVLGLALLVGVAPKAQAEAHAVDAWAGDTFEVSMASPLAQMPLSAPAALAAQQPAALLAVEPEAPQGTQRDASATPAQPIATSETEATAAAPAPPRAQPEQLAKSARQLRSARRRAHKKRARAEAARQRSAHRAARTESAAPPAEHAGRSETTGETTGESTEATADGAKPASSGEMGAAGVPVGLRQLPVAFTRVLPRAAVGDQRFTKQKLGRLGEIHFTLVLDASGRIGRADYAAGSSRLLQELVERTLRFLGKGQFALAPEPRAGDLAGEQQIVVRLSLSQSVASDGDQFATRSLGFEPPRGKLGAPRIGRGYFELESGLRLDAEVEFK